MSSLDLGLDLAGNGGLSETIKKGDMKPVPEGTYNVQFVEGGVEAKQFNKGGSGKIATLKFKITDGEYAGRTIQDGVCFVHSGSPVAQQMGQAHLGSFLQACGQSQGATLEPCLGRDLRVKIKHRPYKTNAGEDRVAADIENCGFLPAAAPAAPTAPGIATNAPGAETTTGAPADTGGDEPAWMQG